MKVIFLDIDGVLNCEQTYIDREQKRKNTKEFILDIDEEKVKLLGYICNITNAKVVLTSTKRNNWINGKYHLKTKKSIKLQELFDKYNIEIIGITPYINNNRQEEIKEYLSSHQEIKNFCIIDDDDFDLYNLKEYLIKTNFTTPQHIEEGLTYNHIKQIVKILNRKND